MPAKAPTFFSVARQPKWIGALLLSLMVAAVFAALGQWQLERSFTKNTPGQTQELPVETVNLMLDTEHVFIVENRLQSNELGFWLISGAHDEAGKSLTVALGWGENLAELVADREALMQSVQAQAFMPHKGIWVPTEAPQQTNVEQPFLLKSVSLAQLINLYDLDAGTELYPDVFVLAQDFQVNSGKLEQIKVTYEQGGASINWLSAFYFLEWCLFAGFAVFLWWRLVKDEQIRLQLETVN